MFSESNERVSFLFTHLLDKVMQALVMLRLGDCAMCQEAGKEGFLPQKQLVVLLREVSFSQPWVSMVVSISPLSLPNCKSEGHFFPPATVRITQKLSNKTDFVLKWPPVKCKIIP